MIIATALALAATTTPVQPLQPAGKWVVDYQANSCLVGRSFGDAAKPVMFALKPSVSIDARSTDLFVLTQVDSDKSVRRGTATVTFQPSGTTAKLAYVSWVPDGNKLRGYEVPIEGDLVETLRQSTGIQLVAGKADLALTTGKIAPVMTALSACIDDLYRSWGVDPKAEAAPVGQPGAWFTDSDYPAEAKRAGAQGRVIILLNVGADGKASACRVIDSSKNAVLDSSTCALAQRRGRFATSTDSASRFSVLSIRWTLFDR